jgi:hypothetical protein
MTPVPADPLEALLTILASERAITLQGLAERLGVAPALIEQMLETLCAAGYLRTLDAACDGHCARCAQGGARAVEDAPCGLYSGSRIWSVTPRGRQAIARG